MAWTFEFTRKAQKQFDALDSAVQSRIKQAVTKKLVVNPKAYLIPLCGDRAGLFKFRVGAYRLLCSLDDDRLYVVVVKVKETLINSEFPACLLQAGDTGMCRQNQ